jgi:type II secretory pathway component PulC
MSLINEALKRAGQEKAGLPGPASDAPSPVLRSDFPPHQTEPSKAPAIVSIVMALCVLVSVSVGMILLHRSTGTPSQAVAVQIPSPDRAPVAPRRSVAEEPQDIVPSVEPQPDVPTVAQAKKLSANFKLSGIMAGPNGEAALINGRLVQVGQTVDGAVLEAISGQTVELDFMGKRITVGL